MGEHENLTVIGAGPVGSLLAVYLAKRGFHLTLYERRSDMRSVNISAGRSINLAVSVRGLHALAGVGLEKKVLEMAIPMRGRLIHARDGKLSLQRYGKDDSECIYSISRGGLNKLLLTEAESSGKVGIHFQQRLESVDLAQSELHFLNEASGEVQRMKSRCIIGADGSASALRKAFQTVPNFLGSEVLLNYGYKELILPARQGGAFAMEKNALHIWPRGHFMLIALPNLDRSFTCTLFLPFKGEPSFEKLDSTEKVSAFFDREFSDAKELLPNLNDEFFTHPTGQMVTVKCSPWNVGGQALLLGDAAHAIVPFFGQGMNCGFEDVSYLDQMLAEVPGGDWSTLFEKFSLFRKPDADAIADMAVENFVEMRDKVADPQFLRMKEIERVLQRLFPSEYISRYSLVTFSRVPYHVAFQAGAIEEGILRELSEQSAAPDGIDVQLATRLIRERLNSILQNHSAPTPR